jgi:hypothetical protein
MQEETGVFKEPDPGADASPEPEVEVVEVDAEAAEAEGDSESEVESPPTDEQNVEEKSDPFQERIDTLTDNFRSAERALESMEQENESLRKKLSDIPIAETPSKTLADFNYNEDEYRQYVFAEAKRISTETAERVVSGFQDKARGETVLDEHKTREKVFAESVDDYQAVAYSDELKISPEMAAEIRASAIGPEIAYYLGKNPDEASVIARMQPREVVRGIVKLEGRLLTEKAKKGKKVSDAPPPPAKIKAAEPGIQVSSTDPKSDKMSDAEWFKAEDIRQAKMRK